MKDLNDFTIGCSNLGTIMAGADRVAITDKQRKELDRLLYKGTPLTEIQDERVDFLISKRDGLIEPLLSEKAKKYLMVRYSRLRYGKRYKLRQLSEMKFSQLLKGTLVETNAVKLLSEIDEVEYHRVKTSIKNEYLYGYLDMLDAETVEKSSRIFEIKNSFDIASFMLKVGQPLSKSIWYQMQGYLSITDKDIGEVAFCLCDFPDYMIQEQREIIFKAMCPDGKETSNFTSYWNQAEKSMRFQDIPAKQRVFSYIVHRDDAAIKKINERVVYCRSWLQKWAAEYNEFIEKRYLPTDDNT
jgi:hypothetical protein